MTKGIIRERFDDLLAEGVHRHRWAPWRTSGSTGQPMSFVRDTAQGYLENLSAQRFLRWMHGIPPAATTIWIAARPVGVPAKGRRWALRGRADPDVHAVSTMKLTPERLEREVRTWSVPDLVPVRARQRHRLGGRIGRATRSGDSAPGGRGYHQRHAHPSMPPAGSAGPSAGPSTLGTDPTR